MEENLRKSKYKLFLLFLKIIPILLAICSCITSISTLLGNELYFARVFGSVSILSLGFLYLTAEVFQFCNYHKMFLHYILVMEILGGIDYYIGIPLNTLTLLSIISIITVIFLTIIVYQYVNHTCKSVKRES